MRAARWILSALFLFGAIFKTFLAHAEPIRLEGMHCFIDGAFILRCNDRHHSPAHNDKLPYIGVSYPVFTADTPLEVIQESDNRWTQAPFRDRSEFPIATQHVVIHTGRDWPDVICLDFVTKGKKHSQTCFDTMEITER